MILQRAKILITYLKAPITYLQISILFISYYFFKILKVKATKDSWVIGVDEIASNIYCLKNILKPSISVSFSYNTFYNFKYDYFINVNNIYLRYLFRLIYAPLLLGYLTNKCTHFCYIWHTGFLLNRGIEFKFLKSKSKKLVCLFVGDDIRSPKLTLQLADKMKIDYHTEYVGFQNPYYLTEKYNNEKMTIAKDADNYSDIIFSFPLSQISYLKSAQNTYTYMYDRNMFFKNEQKFENIKKIKILHAPSNPLVKGTPLIRAAIKKLEIEKYNIEYVELQNMPNEVVLSHLKSSHIVLNQFYAFALGLFGVEAMANHCAVLMSADPGIEISLPQDSKDAWMITKYWEIYDNLKYLLDNPDEIKYYADNGYDFAYKHYTYEAAGKYINSVLKENSII